MLIIVIQKKTAKKRKILVDESDEDVDASAYNKGLSAYEPSPKTKRKNAKKQRIAELIPSDDDEPPKRTGMFRQFLIEMRVVLFCE